MEALDEIVAEFLIESHENLDQLDTDLLALERDPTSHELLGSVFRTIHTIKGTSGFLAFHRLEQLTHVGESLLSRLRDDLIQLNDQRISALLAMVDAVRALLGQIERTGHEGDADHSELIARLVAQLEDSALIPQQGSGPEAAARTVAPGHPQVLGRPMLGRPVLGRPVLESTVRIDVELLDTLMRMVGELVVARNRLNSELVGQQDTAVARSAQRLSQVTGELQNHVMKTRMQPVFTVWSRLQRVVRDVARQCAREVRLELDGGDTELDRSVLEAIRDPLLHLIRNAIDHGIEPPDQRTAAGKPAEGLLLLRAYHEAGQVQLEIIDDGAGIDPAVIAAKALNHELITPFELERMTDREIIQLIFVPGFSTVGAVSNVSGRGVGLDVVKTRVEGIGGSVDVVSTVGSGTTFRLTIPLSLAFIPALTIGCAGQRYAIAQVSVLELVRLSGGHARGGIEYLCGAPVYRLRDTLLPLVHLDELLRRTPVEVERGGFIVVLQAEQQRFGLVVDGVLDTQEIVVKPLSRHLTGLGCYAGATILGDGGVALILDVASIARRANVRTIEATSRAAEHLGRSQVGAAQAEPMLVVQVSGDRQVGIALELISRLEVIPTTSIERVGGREVVRYRGQIMPMVRLADLVGAPVQGEIAGGDPDGGLHVVVHTFEGQRVGFAVDRILDIATEEAGSRSDLDGDALLGSVLIGDRVVGLLDVQAAVLAADPDFFRKITTARITAASAEQVRG